MLFRSDQARADGDFFAEQFIQWFIGEQREEEALFTALWDTAAMAAGDWLAFERAVRRFLGEG